MAPFCKMPLWTAKNQTIRSSKLHSGWEKHGSNADPIAPSEHTMYMSSSAVLWKGTVQINNHLQNIWPDLSGIGQNIQHDKSFHFIFSVFTMKVRNAFCTGHLLNLCTDLLVPSWLFCKCDLMFRMEILSNAHVRTASVLNYFLSHFGGLLLCWTYILYFLFWTGIAIFYGYG